jgi:hypothetical protein
MDLISISELLPSYKISKNRKAEIIKCGICVNINGFFDILIFVEHVGKKDTSAEIPYLFKKVTGYAVHTHTLIYISWILNLSQDNWI